MNDNKYNTGKGRRKKVGIIVVTVIIIGILLVYATQRCTSESVITIEENESSK